MAWEVREDGRRRVVSVAGLRVLRAFAAQFDQAGIPHRPISIWEDPAAAATVRSIARGNETVPRVLKESGLRDQG